MMDGRNQYGRCPFCNKKLGKMTAEYANKHIARCGRKLNPYQYSERKAGRPTNKEVEEHMKQREQEESE